MNSDAGQALCAAPCLSVLGSQLFPHSDAEPILQEVHTVVAAREAHDDADVACVCVCVSAGRVARDVNARNLERDGDSMPFPADAHIQRKDGVGKLRRCAATPRGSDTSVPLSCFCCFLLSVKKLNRFRCRSTNKHTHTNGHAHAHKDTQMRTHRWHRRTFTPSSVARYDGRTGWGWVDECGVEIERGRDTSRPLTGTRSRRRRTRNASGGVAAAAGGRGGRRRSRSVPSFPFPLLPHAHTQVSIRRTHPTQPIHTHTHRDTHEGRLMVTNGTTASGTEGGRRSREDCAEPHQQQSTTATRNTERQRQRGVSGRRGEGDRERASVKEQQAKRGKKNQTTQAPHAYVREEGEAKT